MGGRKVKERGMAGLVHQCRTREGRPSELKNGVTDFSAEGTVDTKAWTHERANPVWETLSSSVGQK